MPTLQNKGGGRALLVHPVVSAPWTSHGTTGMFRIFISLKHIKDWSRRERDTSLAIYGPLSSFHALPNLFGSENCVALTLFVY